MSDDQHRSGEQPPTPDEQAPGRPVTPEGQLSHDLASVDDPWLLDRVVSGDAGDEWTSVTALLHAAAGPAEPHETDGEHEAVVSFLDARRAAADRSAARDGRGAGRVAAVSTLLAGKFAAITVAGVVTLGAGGMAAAAYSGILPAPLQDVAHRTIGAPLPDRDELRPTTTPTTSPTATPHQVPTTTSSTTAPGPRRSTTAPASTTVAQPQGRPVAELCAAWRQQLLPTSAPGYLQLARAAHGSSLDVFCRITPSTAATTPTSTATAEPTATPSDTAPPTDSPSTPPATASDEPTDPPITASDRPVPTTQETGVQPTG